MTAPPRPARRQRRPREERITTILAAARKVFARKGYDAASISDIAREAGVVEGTIYTYVANKRDLLFQVVRQFYEALIAEVGETVWAINGAENRLRYLIYRHLKAFTADLGMCQLVIREIRPDDAFYREAVLDLNRRYTAFALDTVQDGIERGELQADVSPAMVRDVIYGAIEHGMWRHAASGRQPDIDRMADDLTGLVLRGIGARPATEPAAVDRLAELVDRLEKLEEARSP